MPYTISKKGDKHCLYKKGDDGHAMGDSLGCHDSRAKAERQMAAIYANEGKSVDLRELKGLPPDESKSITLYELGDRVSKAIRKAVCDALGVDEYDVWVWCDIFTDFAIAHAPAGMFKVPYTYDAETYDITLGDPQKVKIEYVPDDAPKEEVDEEKEKFAALAKKAAAMTGMADDHQHTVMGSETSEKNGHKHKVKNGKVQMAEGHTHSMPHMDEEKSIDLTIKSLGDNRVGAYAVLWGDESRKDLTGEFFDDKTEELTTIFDAVGKLPLLYHHGLDETLKTRVIGVVDTLKPDSVGLWYEAQLNLADEYDKQVKKLLGDKKLKTSTQTFSVARRVDAKTGHIERWPIVEITATPTPAEYRMPPVAALKSAYAEIGCEDFECVLKTKLGIDPEQERQGAEEARLLIALEQDRALLLDF